MFVAASAGETRFDENEDLYCHYMRSCSTASISDVVRTVSAQVPAVWCRSHFSSSGPGTYDLYLNIAIFIIITITL